MSTLKVNTITDSAGGNTTVLNGVNLRPGMIDSNNRIINGSFDFWQRGTSFSTSVYGADRWFSSFGEGACTQSRQEFAVGESLGDNNPRYFLRQSISGQTSAGSIGLIRQSIEGVRSYAGQTVTILGWAKRSSGSGNMTVELSQLFGTGGSPSTFAPVPGSVTVSLTTSWAPFAATISVPSITGKTIGTDGNDVLNLNLWISAGSDFNSRTNSLGLQTIGVDLWGIHIKVGTHTAESTSLYRMPEVGPELARCQRYYTKLGGTGLYDILVQGPMSTAAAMSLTMTLPVTMRTSPTVTKVGTWGVLTAVQPSVVISSPSTVVINSAGTQASLVGSGYWTIDSTTYLTAEAEL